jgi:hypothetical protein
MADFQVGEPTGFQHKLTTFKPLQYCIFISNNDKAMDENRAIQEKLEKSLDIFTEIRLSRFFYREQQMDAIIKRQRDHIVQLSVIAISAAAIAGAFMINTDNLLLKLSVFILFSSSVIGASLSLDIVYEDMKNIKNSNREEQDLLHSMIKITNETSVTSKLQQKDIEIYIDTLKKATHRFSKSTFIIKSFSNISYKMFILLFYLGLLLLILSLFSPYNTAWVRHIFQ